MKTIIAPPFTRETALQKVQLAEDAWNTCNPDNVCLAYSEDSEWRNRDQFFTGRAAIRHFLKAKWGRELHYRLQKELWAFDDSHISVRFEYEWQDALSGQWVRSYGNEQWAFNEAGLMTRRYASINDLAIDPKDLRIALRPLH